MIVRKYGLTFRRLQWRDIEMVRVMRNSDDIRRHMHSQTYITQQQQEEWFLQVNNMHNYFFVIYDNDNPVGLVQAKNVNYHTRTGEGGIYIWDPSARQGGVGAKASLCLLDIAFQLVKLSTITAKVRRDNPVAHRHNLSFGYRFQSGANSERMILDREDFLSKAARLRKFCSQGNDLLPSSIEDMEFPVADTQLHLYAKLPDDIRATFALKIWGLI
jgi:RimJ/RimL family protein N-acetyltransferase